MGGGTVRALIASALLLVPLLPLAAAAPGQVAFTTDAPLTLDAAFEGAFAGGEGFVADERGTASLDLLANGTLTLWTWRKVATGLAEYRLEDPQARDVPLDGAHLEWVALEEKLGAGIVADAPVAVTVVGSARDVGTPARLLHASERGVGDGSPLFVAPNLGIHWEAGWIPLGTADLSKVPLDAFPELDRPVLRLDGAVRLNLVGGNITVDGRTYRLGDWVESAFTPGGEVRTVWHRRALLSADDAAGTLTPSATWGFAAPDLVWSVNGKLRATRATGEARTPSGTTTFEDATLDLELAGRVQLDVATLRPTAYAADGEVRALRVDGAAIATPEGPSIAPVATLTLSALLLLALTKVGQALLATGAASLYTRLASSELLAHPQRRRIHDVVAAEPGIHQRELHRRLGGAWGPFVFHLRMLEKGGHVRLVPQGAYTLVYAGGAAIAEHAIPHPVARAVYEALPQDGATLPLLDVCVRVGASRELVNYHLKALEARGLARRVDIGGGRRGVARTGQAPRGSNPATPDQSQAS